MSESWEPAGDVLGAMRSLAIDGVTAEVASALDARQIAFILLKGPVISRWLYDDGNRSYRDTDLLIPEPAERQVEEALAALGFRPEVGTGREDPGIARNHLWTRDPAVVELHVTLTGIGAAPADAWATLTASSDMMSIRDRTVRVLGIPARLLHVALHAAQHGPEFTSSIRDLELACAAGGLDDWRDARTLASRLQAVEAMSAGLDLVPAGREIKRELGLPEPSDPLVVLRARSASAGALSLARMAGERPRARATHLLRALLPTPAFLRWWTPIASRGHVGLLAAYVWRYAYLVGALPGAIRSFRRARRV